MDIAGLGIRITTQGVKEGQAALDGLAKSGAAAEKSAQRVGDAFSKANKSFDSRPIREQKEALAALLAQIDPTTNALNKLDDAERKLAAFRKNGTLGSEDFKAYSDKLNDLRNKAVAAGEGMHSFSLNSNFARLELGRLAKDIATGQWGAFERTAFTLGSATGLLGKVFSATGLSIAAVVGVVGTLYAAYQQGVDRTNAFNKAIETTGGYIGTSADRMNQLVESIHGIANSHGAAAEALTKIAETGKFTADQLQAVGEGALAMSELTGQSIDKSIAEFEKMRDEPVKAIVELNEKYHFLTEATYLQIKALEDQGRADEAATLAAKTASAALAKRAEEVKNNVHGMAAAWANLKVIADETWASMVRVWNGQKIDPQDMALKSVESQLRTNKQLLSDYGATYSQQQKDQMRASIAAGEKQVALLREQAKTRHMFDDVVVGTGIDPELEQKVIQWRQDGEKYLTRSQQMEREITKARQQGLDAGRSQLEIEQRIGEIRAKYATKTGGGRRRGDGGVERATASAEIEAIRDAARLRVDALANERRELDQQYRDGEINAASYYELLRKNAQEATQVQIDSDNKQIASLEKRNVKGRESIANQAQIAKLRADIQKQSQDLDAKAAAIDRTETADAAKKQAAVDRYVLSLNKQNSVLQAEWNARVSAIGLGAREAAMRSDVAKATQFEADELEKLNEQLQRGPQNGGITQGQYDQETAALRRATAERVQIIREGYAEQGRAQADWHNGAMTAMANYAESASDVAGMTAGVFDRAFSGMEDVMAQWVTTGKANFGDFAKAVIADFVKMETRILLSKVFQYIMQMYGGGAGTGGAYSNLGGNYAGATLAANGRAYDKGVQFFASGGVVNSATAFAHSGGLGVMGEAGPEAILPLHRGSDGKLGVKTGGASSIVVNAPVTVQTTGEGGGKNQSAANDFGQRLQGEVEATCRRVIADEQRQGGQLWRMQNGG